MKLTKERLEWALGNIRAARQSAIPVTLDGGESDVVIEAASILLSLWPAIEARGKATEGEWKYETGPAYKGNYHTALSEELILLLEAYDNGDDVDSTNIKFCVTAANLLAKVRERVDV